MNNLAKTVEFSLIANFWSSPEWTSHVCKNIPKLLISTGIKLVLIHSKEGGFRNKHELEEILHVLYCHSWWENFFREFFWTELKIGHNV